MFTICLMCLGFLILSFNQGHSAFNIPSSSVFFLFYFLWLHRNRWYKSYWIYFINYRTEFVNKEIQRKHIRFIKISLATLTMTEVKGFVFRQRHIYDHCSNDHLQSILSLSSHTHYRKLWSTLSQKYANGNHDRNKDLIPLPPKEPVKW